MESNSWKRRLVEYATLFGLVLCLSIGIISASETEGVQDHIKGTAIVAFRTGAGGAGHVGVAFQNADGTWTAGAIEGATEKKLSNLWGAVVSKSGDNGGWSKDFESKEEVEKEFLDRKYEKIKEISVENSNPEKAAERISSFKDAGYLLPVNDCLTNTDAVLKDYGVKTNMNLQSVSFGTIKQDPIGSAKQLGTNLAFNVIPTVYFESLPGTESSFDDQVDQSFGDQNDLGGVNFTSIKLNCISVSTDSSGGVNFDYFFDAQKADGTYAGIDPINSTLIGTTAFMTGLAIPNDKFWVNLAPWEPDRIIDDELKQSDVGRIMLEADLQMKKDFSNYGNPCASQIGKEYWMFLDGKREALVQQCMRTFPGEIKDGDNVYFGYVTRHWIVPDEVYAYTNGSEIYIINATLTISSEPVTDHASVMVNNQDVGTLSRSCQEELNRSAIEFSQYAKELEDSMILPYVVADVNQAERYGDLRDVYFALALAQWYKSNINPEMDIFREDLSSSDSDALNVLGPWDHREIWGDYVYSFENGEYQCWENTTTETAQGFETRCKLRSQGGVDFYDINDKLVEVEGVPPEVQYKVERAVTEGFINEEKEVLFGNRVHVNKSLDAQVSGSGSGPSPGSGSAPRSTEAHGHSHANGDDNETESYEEAAPVTCPEGWIGPNEKGECRKYIPLNI